ncbi:P1 family peptidase [Paenactinomyces guangxiensis]|uniref:P1 family peptidase n=1 Tax=Paenactinomyces guangxiensis TaxID=1490290 RepID=A0A7W2A9Q1_9BACL|nr:P1 family peptidase [Paenactinomyces guangxiensis]MBA4495437.1 P1 family peptidase [Paenactinomyces guangxiensis]MBH8592442.1 P1 family peptidase [Paenactinomyces guangxiensis]
MPKKRLRDYGFTVGQLPPGRKNSITDIPGVRVGHVTLHKENGQCTGVTAILPHTGNLFREKVVAATHVINGFGKTTGLIQVNELGTIESPIMLTNTFSVPAVTEGTLRYLMAGDEGIGDGAGSVNIVVGECNDSYLNDMRGLHVSPEHAIEAIQQAGQNGENVIEGNVGAGTGMICFGWKGGIGTSSRQISTDHQMYHIGTLVLTNFGKREDLTILGVPVGQHLPSPDVPAPARDGSIMIIIGTDLPMTAGQLQRLCKRAALGLAKTGAIAHHGSGDIIIAFSNGNRVPHSPDKDIRDLRSIAEDGPLVSECFRAVIDTTEEAILNSLFTAETTCGRFNRIIYALPADQVIQLLQECKIW